MSSSVMKYSGDATEAAVARAGDETAQVPARERLGLGVVLGDTGGGAFDVDAGQSQQRRDQVDMAGRRA